MSLEDREPLRWLKPLLHTTFFHSCAKHPHLSRNECNLYCLDCPGEAICCPCTIDHRNHRMLQIRRSSYHNVIRVSEIHKVLDITGIQTYVINSARVVFVNHRPQLKPVKPPLKTCDVCDRGLPQSYRYCSLACKLQGITQLDHEKFHPRETKRSKVVTGNVKQQPAFADEEDTTKYGDLESSIGLATLQSNASNSSNSGADQIPDSKLSPPTPPPTIDKRNPNRRKGLPHRAPPL